MADLNVTENQLLDTQRQLQSCQKELAAALKKLDKVERKLSKTQRYNSELLDEVGLLKSFEQGVYYFCFNHRELNCRKQHVCSRTFCSLKVSV